MFPSRLNICYNCFRVLRINLTVAIIWLLHTKSKLQMINGIGVLPVLFLAFDVGNVGGGCP